MRVIGIDPGLTRAGCAVVESTGSRLRALEYGTLRAEGETGPQQLAALHARIDEAISRHQPDAMAIERVFFNRNVRTAARTLQAAGVAQCLAALRGLPVYEYGPLEVKSALTGVGNATKEQVQFMVRRVLGLPLDVREPDAADALAIAICALHGRPWIAEGRLVAR
ncbi:MAG: crossover junction endodeoxyribonuclease RuvC [Actinomycetota bacterium]